MANELPLSCQNISVATARLESSGLPPVLLTDVMRMATLNGAKALGLDDVTGTITPGKRADVILIRQDDLNMAPACDIESAVVRVAGPANVDTVFIDGRMLQRNKELIGFDTDALVRDAARSAHAVRTRAGGRLTPPTAEPPAF